MSGIASRTAVTRSQPNNADQNTAVSMPRGTARWASRVSSAVWAEASNPVIV